MQTKNQLYSNKIIFDVLVIIILILIGKFTSLNSADALNTVAGLLIGGIFNLLLEKYIAFDWINRFRYWFRAFEIGLMFLIMALSYLIIGTRVVSPVKMLLLGAYGFCIGLIWGFLEHLITVNRERKLPYSGNEPPILKNKASISYFGKLHSRGIILLLSDRLLFLAEDSQVHEIFLHEIQSMDVQSNLLFPTRLDLYLDDNELIWIHVAMPYIWKKKINETLNIS